MNEIDMIRQIYIIDIYVTNEQGPSWGVVAFGPRSVLVLCPLLFPSAISRMETFVSTSSSNDSWDRSTSGFRGECVPKLKSSCLPSHEIVLPSAFASIPATPHPKYEGAHRRSRSTRQRFSRRSRKCITHERRWRTGCSLTTTAQRAESERGVGLFCVTKRYTSASACHAGERTLLSTSKLSNPPHLAPIITGILLQEALGGITGCARSRRTNSSHRCFFFRICISYPATAAYYK